VSDEATLRYVLEPDAAARRARVATLARALTAVLPVVLAVLVLRRLGWTPTLSFWVVLAALGALIVVRAVVGYRATRRGLGSLSVTVRGDAIQVETSREAFAIERSRVARILEFEGAMGGVRVESEPEAGTGEVLVADVPRGGARWGDVRARLESWRPIERKGRRGPAMRLVVAALVVVGIFFVPFLLEDFVVRSRGLALALVLVLWAALRWTLRPR
jgi:hypothetical protein